MKEYIKYYQQVVDNLKANFLYRELKTITQSEKKSMVDFSHNDYLGLSQDSRLIEGALHFAQKYGVGSGASRLLSGNIEFFEPLEKLIAQSKHKENALIFNSGFQTNLSVISELLNTQLLKKPVQVFSDRLNHSSIHEAIKLAQTKQFRYNHLDMNHLEELLIKHQNDDCIKIIITESVFGMDGDKICIESLVHLKMQYNCLLYIDEAHSTGLYGSEGYGITTDYAEQIDFIMGTFSKALGVSGGYLACSNTFKEYFVNFSKGFIYSTALSPLVCGAIEASWKLIPHLQKRREYVADLSNYTREKLNKLGLNCMNSCTNIIPLLLKEEAVVLKLKQKLLDNKMVVSAIRPPTVPPNSARLRITICYEHTHEQVDRLIDTIMENI